MLLTGLIVILVGLILLASTASDGARKMQEDEHEWRMSMYAAIAKKMEPDNGTR